MRYTSVTVMLFGYKPLTEVIVVLKVVLVTFKIMDYYIVSCVEACFLMSFVVEEDIIFWAPTLLLF